MKVTVAEDGSIEIPSAVRDALGLGPGTYCRLLLKGDAIALQSLEDSHLRCLTLPLGPDTIHSASSTQDE